MNGVCGQHVASYLVAAWTNCFGENGSFLMVPELVVNYLCRIERLREAETASRTTVTELLTILKVLLVKKMITDTQQRQIQTEINL